MICPYCDSDQTRVKDSRQGDDGRYRRYLCLACGERFSTVEQAFAARARTRNARRRLEAVRNALSHSMQVFDKCTQAVDDILESGKYGA